MQTQPLPFSSTQPAKTVAIPFLPLPAPDTSLQQLSGWLDQYERHPIDQGWFSSFPYQPKVAFSLAHGGRCLYLKYYVEEETVLIRFHSANDPVYKDSCVELFIALDDHSYYNLEFNSLGTCLMEFGAGRPNRKWASPALTNQIQRYTEITRHPDEQGNLLVHWQLTLIIPVEVFDHHTISTLSGLTVRGNFQKCGDDTPQPHFLSWNKIDTPEPDFHQPRFFGQLRFNSGQGERNG